MDPRTESNVAIAIFLVLSIAVGVVSSYTHGILSSSAIIIGGGLLIAIAVDYLLAEIHMMGAIVDGIAAGLVAILIAIITKIVIWLV